MALLPIYHIGNDVLRQQAQPITNINNEIRQLANDMIDTMRAANGLGLAGPQVGQSLRIFVIDPLWLESAQPPYVFINPEILSRTGSVSMEEGCLSVPGIYEEVERAEQVTATYLDLDGVQRMVTAEGIFARAIQHENDHLDGKIFVDYVTGLRKKLLKRKLLKIQKKQFTIL